MTQEITTGGIFYYGLPIQVRGIFTMRDKVDRDDLQRAVDTAMPRFPYFCIRAVEKDGRYVQEYNDAPFVVLEREDPPAPGTAEVNGHMHIFGCWENKIYADFFHGIGDGRGTVPTLVESVLYYYCKFHYDEGLQVPGVILADSEPAAGEYEDPFLYAKKPEKLPVSFQRVTESFAFPEPRVAPGEAQNVYTFNINQKEFMKYTKSVDGSPAAIAALFLCRAIDAVHPERTLPIVANMPVDIRSALGCDKTCQNCIDFLQLVYTTQMRDVPLDRQATGFRGQIFLQSDKEYLNERFYNYVQEYRLATAAPTVAEKHERLLPSLPVVPGSCVSYMGQLSMGDVDRYRLNFRGAFDATGFGIVIEIYCAGDTLSVCLMNGLQTDAYIQAFIRELDAAGLNYEMEEPFRNPARPLPDCFQKDGTK